MAATGIKQSLNLNLWHIFFIFYFSALGATTHRTTSTTTLAEKSWYHDIGMKFGGYNSMPNPLSIQIQGGNVQLNYLDRFVGTILHRRLDRLE